MKKNLLALSVVAVAMSAAFAVTLPEKSAGAGTMATPDQTQAAVWASRVLGRYHYKATPLDDAMSAKIFDRYFEALDGEKLFFLQSDVDQFAASRTQLDDAINNENLTLPFQIYDVYQKRFNARMAYARELLKTTPDFTLDESYKFDREKEPWAKSEEEIRDLWRKRVKNDWLRLKLAGKDDKSIREMLDKRYESTASRIRKLNNEDVFQMFMNAYAMSIEPHTNYMGPKTAENFDISMRLSLEGIGAVLQSREDYTVIREVVPGSPAALAKIQVGDRVMGVAQGDGPIVDVMGMRIDDVVAKVRGPKGTTVRLDILPADAGPDGKHKIVPIVRKKISMEEQAAKKSVIEVKDGAATRRVGVISLPTFYQDFDARRRGDKDFKSATRDVARILAELKKEKVDNVLIDLRNNGGGSLTEAVELTGLFIDRGPVVQQRTGDGKVDVEADNSAGLAWDGPVGVLINRGSASASEIFAAAIQDYGRGIIIGEPSFGKGTVQTLVPLDRFAQNENARYGELKMTIAQFFRINGGTTQLRGVTPDIALPSMSDPDSFGEASFDNALPYTSIKPAFYVPSGNIKEIIAPLQARHQERVAKDKDFQFLKQDIAELIKQRKENSISLNEAVRRKERDRQEERAKQREARLFTQPVVAPKDEPQVGTDSKTKAPPTAKDVAKAVPLRGLPRTDDGLQGDERSLQAELAAEAAAKNAKDVLLNEAANILADEVALLKTDARMASRVMPYSQAWRGAANP
ncbi:carboxy terminal-processing peptidase [Pseudoduganella sp. GCM10020061]|uniref:carboxy terminal-processing peptidase n=1 Tax=Pseudoduganella sp. GCM10020061 TaxID=3317345 RepID=UPI003628D903